METIIGKVQGLEGRFFAKDADGDIVELRNGDSITKGMTVLGDPSNDSSAMITVAMLGTDQIINLSGSSEQLFDDSLINEDELDGALAEETVDSANGILAALEDSETTDAGKEEVVDEETAAGEETADGSGDSSDVFDVRDGSATDIVAGLRDAPFAAAGTTNGAEGIIPDYEPEAGDSFAAVDDDGLSNGNPLSTNGNDGLQAVYTGTLNVAAVGDFPLTIGFSAMDGQTATVGTETVVYSWNAATETLTATINGGEREGTDLFVAEMTDSSTGEYRIELLDNVMHPTLDGLAGDNTENNVLTALTFTVTDNNGSSDNGTLTINFDDDMPTIDIGLRENQELATLTTQDADTIGDNSDTAYGYFGNAFSLTSDMGADDVPIVRGEDFGDGERGLFNSGGSLTFALSVTTSDSGLTSEGEAITLSVNNAGVIEGSTQSGGVIFSVSVTSWGEVRLTQNSEIDHVGDGNDTNIGLLAGNVVLTASASITDADGDTATDSQSLDISSSFSFDDDTPTVDVELARDIETLHSTDGVLVAQGEIVTEGNGTSVDQWSFTHNGGALTIDMLSERDGHDIDGNGNSSNLDTYIRVFDSNGIQVGVNDDGRSAGFGDGSTDNWDSYLDLTNLPAGTYTLSVGAWSLSESEARADHNDSGGTTGAYQITFTGDIQSAYQMDDNNAPLVELPTLTTQDEDTIGSESDTDSASFASLFTLTQDAGADDLEAGDAGVAELSYSLSVTSATSGLTSQGEAIILSVNSAGVIEGSTSAGVIFSVAVNETTGEVTLTQNSEIDHVGEALDGDSANNDVNNLGLLAGNVVLTASATIIDDDGDTATDSESRDISSSISFDDDTPSINVESNGTELLLQESFENFRTSNGWNVEHGGGDINGQDNSSSTDITGDHGVVWDVGAEGVEIQRNIVTTSDDGNAHAELDPHTYDGSMGNTVMTTSVDLNGSNFYTLEFAYQPRATGGTSDMEVEFAGKKLTIDSTTNNLVGTLDPNDGSVEVSTTSSANGWTTFTVVYSGVTGDSADLTFSGAGESNKIGALLDDIKLYSGIMEPTLQVDETDLTIDHDGVSFAGSFSSTSDAGADGQDGAIDTTYTLGVKAVDTDSGLVDTATGQAVILNVVAGVVEGRTETSGELVFTVSTTNTGLVSLDQVRAMVHADNTDHNDVSATITDDLITLTREDTITDNDGDTASDSATLNIGSNISFLDDGLSAANDELGTLAEDSDSYVLEGSIQNDILANDTFGADGFNTVSLANGENGVGTYGTIVFNNDGTYTYTLANDSAAVQGLDEGQTEQETFQYSITDKDGDTSTATLTINVTGADENTPPTADPVSTTSNQDTDGIPDDFPVSNIAFFKSIDIGGGLDGDLSVKENDVSDPADLGGSDAESAEGDLVFDITTLPTYGTLHIEIGGVYTEVDTNNLDEASTLLSTADNVYWSATHTQVPSGDEHTVGGNYSTSNNAMQDSWDSDDVTILARSGNNHDADISYNNRDGIGVTGANNSGIAAQLGYDPVAKSAESIIVDFKDPATDATVEITHLIRGEGGGEIGTFEAFLDGASLGTFTFSNSSNANADYTLTAEAHGFGNGAGGNSGTLNIDDLVFDQLRFSAQEYADQDGKVNDSSDYFIGEITYHDVPGVEFEYKVTDEDGLSSDDVKVVIDVDSDTPIPPVSVDLPVLSMEIETSSVPAFTAEAYNGNNGTNGSLRNGNATISGNPSNQEVTTQDEGVGIFGNVNNGNSGTSDSQGIDDDETLIIKLADEATSVSFKINTDLGSELVDGAWTTFDKDGNQNSVNTSFTVSANGVVTITATGDASFQYVSFEGHNYGEGASDAGFYVEYLIDGEPVSNNYEYTISLDADLSGSTDIQADLTDITLSNLPAGTSLSGTGITDNGNDTYTIAIDADGKANVTLVSPNELDASEIDAIDSSVSKADGSITTTDNQSDETTLTLDGEIALDFSDANIESIENISLDSGTSQNLTLSLDDVLDMTEADGSGHHTLDISSLGIDDEDSVAIDTTGWAPDAGNDNDFSNGETYSNGSGDSITLTVDDNIEVV